MVGEGGVSTPWQNDFCGRIMANLLGKANRGGQAPVKIQLKGCKDRRTRVRDPARDPPTLPDPVLYTVIVSYICIRKPYKKIFILGLRMGEENNTVVSYRDES